MSNLKEQSDYKSEKLEQPKYIKGVMPDVNLTDVKKVKTSVTTFALSQTDLKRLERAQTF